MIDHCTAGVNVMSTYDIRRILRPEAARSSAAPWCRKCAQTGNGDPGGPPANNRKSEAELTKSPLATALKLDPVPEPTMPMVALEIMLCDEMTLFA